MKQTITGGDAATEKTRDFDAMKAAKSLQQAGLPEEQAAAVVEVIK